MPKEKKIVSLTKWVPRWLDQSHIQSIRTEQSRNTQRPQVQEPNPKNSTKIVHRTNKAHHTNKPQIHRAHVHKYKPSSIIVFRYNAIHRRLRILAVLNLVASTVEQFLDNLRQPSRRCLESGEPEAIIPRDARYTKIFRLQAFLSPPIGGVHRKECPRLLCITDRKNSDAHPKPHKREPRSRTHPYVPI